MKWCLKWHFGDHFGHEFGDDIQSDLRSDLRNWPQQDKINVRRCLSPLPEISRKARSLPEMSGIFREDCVVTTVPVNLGHTHILTVNVGTVRGRGATKIVEWGVWQSMSVLSEGGGYNKNRWVGGHKLYSFAKKTTTKRKQKNKKKHCVNTHW